MQSAPVFSHPHHKNSSQISCHRDLGKCTSKLLNPNAFLAHNQFYWGRLLPLSPERVKIKTFSMLLNWSSTTSPTVPYMYQFPPQKLQLHQWCVWESAAYEESEREHYHRWQSRALLMPHSWGSSKRIKTFTIQENPFIKELGSNASFPGYSRELIFFKSLVIFILIEKYISLANTTKHLSKFWYKK